MHQQHNPPPSHLSPDNRSPSQTKDRIYLSRHEQASKTASNQPARRPISFCARLRSFTSWPHTSPKASEMAEAGFHQVRWSTSKDLVQCARCQTSLMDWKPDDDPLHEHMKRSPECFAVGTSPTLVEKARPKPVPKKPSILEVSGSAPPKAASPSTKTPTDTPPTTKTAKAIAVEESVSSQPTTSSPAHWPTTAPFQHILRVSPLKESNSALPKADLLANAMEDIPLESEEWVDIRFEGEEKDDWIEVGDGMGVLH